MFPYGAAIVFALAESFAFAWTLLLFSRRASLKELFALIAYWGIVVAGGIWLFRMFDRNLW